MTRPDRQDDLTLKLRGSWLAAKREKDARQLRIKRRKVERWPVRIRDLEGICRTGIPGYDPWAQAGDCVFDIKAARAAVGFFHKRLTHVKGELAFTMFRLERWQIAVIGNLYGWRKTNGLRRYRECLIFVPRKNGKTTLAAGILLYMLTEAGEYGAEIYGAASEYRQASLVFEHARGMVHAEREYFEDERGCTLYGIGPSGHKAIQRGEESGFATYRVICSKDTAAHGFNTYCAVIDELHTQKDRRLVDALITSTGSRDQPLIVHITTSDFDREGSICNEKHDYASKVRDGVIDDPSFLPVIYEASEDADWTDPKVWAKANPNLDVSLSREYLERECKRAQETPTFENEFKRLHLNIRTQQDILWLSLKRWDACDDELGDLEGQECYAGLDLATTTDICALVLVFPSAGNAILPFFWVPADNARDRERRDRVPYETWGREQLLELTPGNVVDYALIRKKINELGEIYDLKEIAIDRWNSTQLQTELSDDGFKIVQFGQGFASMSAPTKELERMVLAQECKHAGNKVLRWMATNVSVEMDAAGNLKPSKKKSIERIDGIVALVMAIGRMQVKWQSVYEDRGLMVIG